MTTKAEVRRRNRRLKQLREERKSIRAGIPWGVPWCSGGHAGPCEGCACRDYYDDQVAAVDAQIDALLNAVTGKVVRHQGELF